MHEPMDLTAWSSFLLGMFTLFTGIGVMRRPNFSHRLIDELSASASQQQMVALVEMMLGALVYLANPWISSDLLSCFTKFVGGCMMIEGLTIAIIPDLYANFWLKNFAHQPRLWACFSITIGLTMAIPGMLRLS